MVRPHELVSAAWSCEERSGKEVIPLEETKKQIESLQNLISGGIIDASEGERKIYMLKEKKKKA